jgi:hypothetical protein
MKRIIISLIAVCILSSVALAQSPAQPVASAQIVKPYHFIDISDAVFAAGATADNLTSLGQFERNSLLRKSDGTFSPTKGFAFKATAWGLTKLLDIKHPRLGFWFRIVSGVTFGSVAAHNAFFINRRKN